MLKISLLASIAVLTITGCSNEQITVAPKYNAGADTSTPMQKDIRAQMFSYLNAVRVKGTKCAPPAPPVQFDRSLQEAAMSHTKDMAINSFLKHNGSGSELDIGKPELAPTSTFIDRITYFGYPVRPYLLVGENITYTKFTNSKSTKVMPNVQRAINNWINDETHCKILMNPRFKYAGFAYQRTKDRYYFTLNLAEDSKK